MPNKPGRKRKTTEQCQAVTKEGVRCQRGATLRVQGTEVWVCTPHRAYGKKQGRPEVPQATRLERARRKKQRYRKSNLECAFTTKAGVPCMARVTARLADGRDTCKYHLDIYTQASVQDQAVMEGMAVDTLIDTKLLGAKKRYDKVEVSKRRVVDMPDIEEQMELLDQEDQKRGHKIQFKEAPRVLTGTQKSAFFGIDVEYYTPEFKVDYVYMLIAAIRRAEAQVNILFQQLQRIEEEEAQLKETVQKGNSIVDGKIMDFENVTTVHATPIHLKLKLIENLTKAEAHYAKLLKQMEELPLTCLMVMRKLGVRWDRDAAMMVINKLEKENKQILSDFGALDVAPQTPMPLAEALEIVSEDPQKAKAMKQLMQADDW